MSNRQVMQQALEALDIVKLQYTQNRHVNEAITALREALAREHAMHDLARLGQEIEQEPSAWRDMVVVSLVREGINKHRARELADHFAAQPEPVACRFCHSEKGCWAWQCYNCGEIDDVQKPAPPAAQPEQEPVAVKAVISAWSLRDVYFDENGEPLMHTTPPQRPWQGLTDDDWGWVADKKGTSLDTFDQGAAWAANQLRRRNT